MSNTVSDLHRAADIFNARLDSTIARATTAQLRELARHFERSLDWLNAGLCYDHAVARYPGNPKSRLCQADIARLADRAAACYATAEWETRESERFASARECPRAMRINGTADLI